MSIREIPAAEWKPFLEEFTRGHRAWLATVERAQPGERGHVEVSERPLGAVTPEISARRIVRIEIQFQDDLAAPHAIHVDAPAHVRVDEAPDGAARALEIDDVDGECTRIRFRVAPLPEMLDGIAPGELPQNPA